jgi:hypothetical protein
MNGTQPAGMKISAVCCKANKFPDDDGMAIDMTKICNSAGRTRATIGGAVALATMILFFVGVFN